MVKSNAVIFWSRLESDEYLYLLALVRNRRIIHLSLITLLLLSNITFSQSLNRNTCHHTRGDLLSMPVEDAYRFLLELYDDLCPLMPYEPSESDILQSNGMYYIDATKLNRKELGAHKSSQIFLETPALDKNKGMIFDTFLLGNYATKARNYADKSDEYVIQFDILSKFYDYFNGDHWFVNDGWKNQFIPVCQWFGVQCYRECLDVDVLSNTCPVVGVWLSKNNLHGDIGSISYTLEHLPYLMSMDLNRNSIFGNLPDFNLPYMSYLGLFMNQLTGEIPDFKGIPYMYHLELDENILEGTVPEFSGIPFISTLWIGASDRIEGSLPLFSAIPNVQTIGIYGTKIQGTLPDFHNIPNVFGIYFYSNNLKGTVLDFDKIPNVYVIGLSYNQLSGSIPDFSQVPNAYSIDLHSNQLIGTVPDFSKIPNVNQIYLYDNYINGTIPDFSAIPYVYFLVLSSNWISGEIPNFSGIPNLILLGIDSNQLNGTIPDFSGLPGLRWFYLYNNQLTGSIPNFSSLVNAFEIRIFSNQLTGTIPNFSKIPNILVLYLHGNQLNGTIPEFSEMKNILIIGLSSNQLEGTIPDFYDIPSVSMISISSNRLNGTIPCFIYVPSIKTIDVANNKLTGTIPNFDSLYALGSLDVSKNHLYGTIPEFSNLINLKYFWAYENQLEGHVPSFKSCDNLSEILLFRNNLRGPLPSFKLAKLTKIDISENQINYSIPNDWDIASIQFIDISRNVMNDTIPNFFEKLYQLKSVILSHNKFSGTLPTWFWSLPNLVTIDLRNNTFEGEVGEFLVPANSNQVYNYSYENIFLDDNKIYGEFNWRVLECISNVKTFSLKNNNITKLGELSKLLKWSYLDLSGNPITGHIPESYNRFTKLEYLGLKNTSINRGVVNFLPKFMNYTDPFNLEDESKLYICPSIVSKLGLAEMKVDINPNYYDFEFCSCLPGYFGFGDNCIQCPRECECVNGKKLENCYASPNAAHAKAIIPCPRPDSCKAFIPYKTPTSNKTIEITEICEKGYEDRACSKCQDSFGGQGRLCVTCEKSAIYSTLILGFIGFCSFIFYLYRSETSKSAKLRIIMFHMQTLSIVSSGLIQADNANRFIDVSSSVSSIQLPNISCAIGMNSIFASLLISFTRILIFLVIGSIFYHFGSIHLKNKAITITANLLFFIYYSIAREVFGVFGCTVYDDGENSWYLNYAPWIECNPVSNEYKRLLGLAVPVFIVFLIGLPVFVWWKLKFMIQKPGNESELRYGFLYMPYKENYKYWEFVIIARRIAFSFTISVIPYTSPSVFFLLLVIVIQVSIWVHQKHTPYTSDLENKMEMTSLYTIFLSLFLALLSNLLGSQTWIAVLTICLNLMWIFFSTMNTFVIPFFKSRKQVNQVQVESANRDAEMERVNSG